MPIVRAFPRIHISLLDLGNASFRKYGGAGFLVEGLPVEVEATRSSRTSLAGLDLVDRRSRKDLLRSLARLHATAPNAHARVRIESVPPQHVGLGSKTALILGVLRAFQAATGLELTRPDLQELSGRGGTSGVGVNGFFEGGFLIDGGHDPSISVGFAPSSARREFEVPPVICRLRIPRAWRFYLILPPGRRIMGREEARFFGRNAPVPASEVLRSIALVYHGVAPAVSQGNLRLLKKAIHGLHEVGFKRRELLNQSPAVREFLAALNEGTHMAVGLSSLGPLVYAISDGNEASVAPALSGLCLQYNATLLGHFRGRNSGHEVLK